MVSMREREKEFKKQIIAEAAYELLAQKPYEAVTVDEIAKAAGCGKGTLYQYFENKDHILAYLVAEDVRRLSQQIREKCLENLNIQEAIYNYLVLQYNYYLENNQIFSSWLRRRLDEGIKPEWGKLVHERLENKIKMMALVFERGIRENSLINVDPVQLARVLENIFRDINYSFNGPKPDEEERNKLFELIQNVLANGIFLNQTLEAAEPSN